MPAEAIVMMIVLLVLVLLSIGGWVWSAWYRRQLNPILASKSARSTGTVTVPLGPEAAARAVRHAMHLIGMYEVPPSQGHIEAKTPTTFWSWGERVSVILQPGPHGTAVAARSVPLLPTVVFDYGKSQRNVELLLRKVHELAHASVRS